MRRFDKPILVTRPFLPPLNDFMRGCEEIWESQWLTNNGPKLLKFQELLADYWGVSQDNIALFNNGTLALELGYYSMGLAGGEVITTPFTFVATSHALVRIGATPVFGDISEDTMCLTPETAERLITSKTKAIVPVHVYGCVCDVEGFEELSKKYGIKIIYDAAHAFGIKKVNGLDRSLVSFGDMSMFSFHPTKLFHSCEGGALIFKDGALQEKLHELRNFAIKNELECVDIGTNAKMNELQALMGTCCLQYIDELLKYRRDIYNTYAEIFEASNCVTMISASANKAYIPVLFKDFETREYVYKMLVEKCNVFSRRYFYPLLTQFKPYKKVVNACPIAMDISCRILTLPTYYGLPLEDVRDIAKSVVEIIQCKRN